MKKDELRSILRQSRESLSAEEVADRSTRLTQIALDEIDWSTVHSLHIYSSVDEWREVDTKDLIRKLSSQWPGIKIVQPTLMRDNPIPKEKFDVIVVPVLGFDKDLHRLGLGGGWYDKFLATQPQALKVGLAYHFGFIKDGFAHETHDIPLDIIITEKDIID